MGSKSSSPIGGYYPTSQNTASNTSGSGTQTQTQSPAALAAQVYQKALQNAAGIASTPFQPYQGQLVAGFTPAQIAAQQGYQNALGMASPYYSSAANYYNQSAQNLTNPLLPTAQNLYNQSLATSNPANYSQATLSQYMNPYQQDVVNATMNQLANLQNQTTARNTADSVRRGSYGGSGQFMGQSQIANQQALANAQTLAGLNAQNYQNAQQQYNQQQQQAVAAQQAAANALGQLGYQQQNLGINALQQAGAGLGNVGAGAQQSYLQGLQALAGSGQTQQQLAQKQLEAAYQQWQNALAFPYQQTSYLSGLASGLGPLLGSTTGMDYSSTANQTGSQLGMQPYQNQSGGGGLAGLATTGLGLISSLIPGMPKFKDGGRVNGRQEFADGGVPEDDETPSFTRDLGSMAGTKPYSSAGSYSDDALMSFGSSAKSLPYSTSNPNNYIGRSLKLSKVIPSAKQLLANKLTSAISQSLGTESPNIEPLPAEIKSSFFGGSSDDNEFSGAPGLKSTDEYKLGAKLGNAYNKYTSESSDSDSDSSSSGSSFGSSFGDLLSGLKFAEGGRVYKDDGGSASSSSPITTASKSFGELLDQAYAASPGRQLSPTEQGMPAMPDQSYYTQIQPTFASLTTPTVPYPSSSAGGKSSASSVPANYLDLSNTAASMTAPNLISTMYNQYMNRLPTEDEQNYWQGQLRGGQSTKQMEQTIASDFSSQNKAYIDNLYQNILNRNPNSDEVNFWMGQLQGGASAADIQNAILNSGARQESSVVQGYYPTIASTTVNPVTGLFNLKYTAPYKSQPTPYAPSYSADGGRITKSKGGSLSGSDLYSYLINLGATNKEATMLTAMAKAESGFNPTVSHDRGTGYGLWGHGKDRWSDMQRFTGATRPGWQDQARFALNELRTSPKTALARSTLEKADSPSQITIAGMHFERPQGYTTAAPWLGHNFQGRLGNVQNLMLGKDLGTGPQLNIASGGEPNRQSIMFQEPRTEAPAASAEAPATEEPEKKQGFAELLGSAVGKLTEPSGESSAPKLATAGDLGPISMPTNVGPRAFLDTASLGGAGNMQNRYLDSLLESVLEKTDRSTGGQVRQHFQDGGSDEESRNRFYQEELEGSAPQYDPEAGWDTAGRLGELGLNLAALLPAGRAIAPLQRAYKVGKGALNAFRNLDRLANEQLPEQPGLGAIEYQPQAPRGRQPSAAGEPIPMGIKVPKKGMNRFEANTEGMRRGIPGDEVFQWSSLREPVGSKPMNAFEQGQTGLAWNRFGAYEPNKAPAYYDNFGTVAPPKVNYNGRSQRPISEFEANQGYFTQGIPGRDTRLNSVARGPASRGFGSRDMGFTPAELGQELVPLGPRDMSVSGSRLPAGKSNLPTLATGSRGGGGNEPPIYADYNDVSGNILGGPRGGLVPSTGGGGNLVPPGGGGRPPRNLITKTVEAMRAPPGSPPGSPPNLPAWNPNITSNMPTPKLTDYYKVEQPVVSQDKTRAKRAVPRVKRAMPQDNRRYWGDWRDTEPFESDPIGNFLDSLTRDERVARRPGNINSPMSPYAGKGFEDILPFADGGSVRHAYAKGGTQPQEEEFDPLGDIGRGLGDIGDTISQGLGGLFGGGEEAAPVVAADRGAAPSRPERRGPGPISQALIAAGLGMMASPSRSALRAIGEGGLQGMKVYQTAADEQRKQDLLDAQRESNLAFNKSLAGLDSMRSGTSAPSSSSTAEAPTTSPTSTGVTPPVAPVSPVVATDRESDIGNQINQSIARIDWLNTHQPQNADQEKALKHYIEAEKTKLGALKMRQEEADRSAKAKQDAYEHSEEGRLQTAMGQNLAKDIAETASGIDKAAREAKPIIDEFETYEKILKSGKVSTGMFGPARHAANKLAVETGYASPETIQAARFGDLIKSGGLRQMLIQMGGRLGAGISDADRRAIEQTSIGLEQNQEYNIDMVETMINMQKRAQAMGKFTEDYRKEHNGHLDAGYTAALSEWANKQPNVTSKRLRESLGMEGGSATSSYSGPVAVNPKTGKRIRPSDDGKSWVEF